MQPRRSPRARDTTVSFYETPVSTDGYPFFLARGWGGAQFLLRSPPPGPGPADASPVLPPQPPIPA